MKAIYRSSKTRSVELEVANRNGDKCDLKNASGRVVVSGCTITGDDKVGTCSIIIEAAPAKSTPKKSES